MLLKIAYLRCIEWGKLKLQEQLLWPIDISMIAVDSIFLLKDAEEHFGPSRVWGEEKRMQIGLLEDNPSIATLLSTVLRMAGHSVSPSYDGVSFLAGLFASDHISRSIPYDLLLVDLYLPGRLSGWEVVSSIRRVIPAEKLPIIVISAASVGELKQFQASHPDIPVLQKPFGMGTLLEQMKMLACTEEQSQRT